MEFRVTTHMVTGKPMVGVWQGVEYIASIYGHKDGMRIVSKYLDGIEHEAGTPQSIVIKFSQNADDRR